MRVAVTVVALALCGCTPNRVEVQCQSTGNDVACSVKHTTGSDDVEACFDAVIQCRNGVTATAHACQALAPEQTASKTLRDDDFRGIDKCDAPNGFTVANMKITRK